MLSFVTVNLVLCGNRFAGQIRDSFSMWKSLDFVDMSDNELTGLIPTSLFNIPTLRIVYLSNNMLEGEIPSNYGNPPLLVDLYLDGNRLQGTVPPISLGQLTSLTEFLLDGNNLSGTMPTSVCRLVTDGTLQDLWADCKPPAEIQCAVDCCTQCF